MYSTGKEPKPWEPTRRKIADLLATRKLLDHTPRFLNLVSVPFDFDPATPAPTRWLRFLDDLWGDDADSIGTLQEFFGLRAVRIDGTAQDPARRPGRPDRGGAPWLGSCRA
jgi:hypothetical protein